MSEEKIIAIFYLLLCILLLFGCKTRERVVTVTVPESHFERVARVDTVSERDSVIREIRTEIIPADSSTLARYGVHVADGEVGWLVRSTDHHREVSERSHTSSDTVLVRDTIPVTVPVEVVKEIPAQLSRWQRVRMSVGSGFIGGLLVSGLIFILKKRIKRY